MGPITVQTSLSLAFAILSEAALSFLGLGVQPPDCATRPAGMLLPLLRTTPSTERRPITLSTLVGQSVGQLTQGTLVANLGFGYMTDRVYRSGGSIEQSSLVSQLGIDAPALDAARLREATGWEPVIPLERTVADALEDWRERLR